MNRQRLLHYGITNTTEVKSHIKYNDSRICQTGAKLTLVTVKTLLASNNTNNLNDPYNTNKSNNPHNQNNANNPSTSDNNKNHTKTPNYFNINTTLITRLQ